MRFVYLTDSEKFCASNILSTIVLVTINMQVATINTMLEHRQNSATDKPNPSPNGSGNGKGDEVDLSSADYGKKLRC